MTEEEKKNLLGDLYEKLNKAQQANQHQSVLDHTEKLLQVDSDQEPALRARLAALIKQKSFDIAIDLIKGKEKQFAFEHAYILHRQGKNQDALKKLQQAGINKDDTKSKHLFSQIQYKLNDYKSSINNYQDIIQAADKEDYSDIVTNMLACSSNYSESIELVQKLVSSLDFEKTYEFYFNLGQVQMKQQLYQDAMKNLLKSYEMAKEDGSDQSDLTRFKVQEIHQLTSFYNEFNLIEYGDNMKLNLPKSIKNENLVELNMNAFAETYEVNKAQVKELIGNLNWRKLSERIHQQLNTNQNLTADQKRLLEINSVVSLLRSHQFEEARKEWEIVSKHNDHYALRGIGAFFYLKDNKYDEALNLIKNQKDTYSVFLRSQIYFAKKDSQKALENLIQNLNESLIQNDEYVIFIIRTSLNNKQQGLASQVIDKVLKVKNATKNKDLLLYIVDILIQLNKQKDAQDLLKQLFDVHGKESKEVQSRYLSLMSDINIQEASKIREKLQNPLTSDMIDNDEYLQQLIEDGMPEKKKEKKTKNIVQETKGGAEIFIPKRKKKRVRYPKNFDPKNPGPEPDAERWLPKWQRSRYKKYAKKKGLYLKGAQGDAQIDTDVTGGIDKSTAHKEVVTEKTKNKRRKK